MSVRKASASLAAAPPRRRVVVAAASSTQVPPNVAEARAWIAAWRAKQGQAAAASNGNGNGAAPAAPATPTKAAGKSAGGKFGGAAAADGTVVFTADQLMAVNYSDVKLKQGKKK